MESIDETKAIFHGLEEDDASVSDDSTAQGSHSQSIMDIAFQGFMSTFYGITGGVRHTFEKTSKFLQQPAPGADFIYEFGEFSRESLFVASLPKSKLKSLANEKEAVHTGNDAEIASIEHDRQTYEDGYAKESGKARTYANAQRKLSVYIEQAKNGKEAAEREMKLFLKNIEELDEAKQRRIMKCTIAYDIDNQPLDQRRWAGDYPLAAIAKELGTDCTDLKIDDVEGKFHALSNLGFSKNTLCPKDYVQWRRLDDNKEKMVARLHKLFGLQQQGTGLESLPHSPTQKRKRSEEVPSEKAIQDMEEVLEKARAKRRRFLEGSRRS